MFLNGSISFYDVSDWSTAHSRATETTGPVLFISFWWENCCHFLNFIWPIDFVFLNEMTYEVLKTGRGWGSMAPLGGPFRSCEHLGECGESSASPRSVFLTSFSLFLSFFLSLLPPSLSSRSTGDEGGLIEIELKKN